MSSQPPSKKRPRTEGMPTENSNAVTRSDTLWFDDGNIIIQAETTQFKVHRSVLSLHSKVLADCFGLPQPDGELSVDGCAVVHLTDEARDIAQVFSLMYGNYSPFDLQKTISFSLVAAMIRLGRKYEFSQFLKEAIRRLQAEFPMKCLDKSKYSLEYIGEECGTIFEIINILVEFSLHTPLPSAVLYLLKDYSTSSILSGEQRLVDGTHIRLTPVALRTVLIVRSELASVLSRFTLDLLRRFADLDNECDDKSMCVNSLASFFTELEFLCGPTSNDAPIRFPPATGTLDSFKEAFCDSCKDGFLDEGYNEVRKELWNEIPSYLGLVSWEELKDLSL